jgi:hypothetical protein
MNNYTLELTFPNGLECHIDNFQVINPEILENNSGESLKTKFHDDGDQMGEPKCIFEIMSHCYHYNGEKTTGTGVLSFGEKSYTLEGIWPSRMDFGYLDYSSSPDFDFFIDWSYARIVATSH